MKFVRIAATVVATLAATFAHSQKGIYTMPPGMPAVAPSLVSIHTVTVPYVNKFRFRADPEITQVAISAAPVTPALGPTASSISNLPTLLATPAAAAAVTVTSAERFRFEGEVAPPPDPCNQVDMWPTSTPDRILRITKCWIDIRGKIETQRAALVTLRTTINQIIRANGEEQLCYALELTRFSNPILNEMEANQLVALAIANAKAAPTSAGGCRRNSVDDWNLSQADAVGVSLLKEQQDLADLTTALGYSDWAGAPTSVNQTANTTLVKLVGDFIAEANSYSIGTATTGAGSAISQTYSDFLTVVASNKKWRERLSGLFTLSSLKVDVNGDACNLWYGKGRTDTFKLHAADLTTSAETSQDITLATNTCNPRTIASSGVGVSFLASPTYAFITADNTGAQVIGETTVNKQSPLYAVLYNIQLTSLGRGVELFASPGVGLTSTSSTTTSDFLAGLSVSFARRVLFVTPSADFGRRDQLSPGFQLGTAKGSLTAVPTQSHWPVGFMISVSFGIGPS